MANFFSSLFGGSNPTLSSAINKYGQQSGFDVGLGQSDSAKSSNFFSSILSGDQAQVGKALAPEIKGIQDQNQQNKNQTAQFSNRSGGNNSSMQQGNDQARSSINSMISSLLGSSATSLGQIGSNLISQGQSALGAQVDASQTQLSNWSDSILGKGITSGAAAGESFAMGKM